MSVSENEEEEETEVVTVNNVNEWLNSLHVAPTSSNIVEVDISEEGFQNFDRYQIEYTTSDRPDQWKQVRTFLDYPKLRTEILLSTRHRISRVMIHM